ncbi:hypothetical protein [Methyloversatilis thermotolerans]|uniref:hypothetical protein n=1 Tax=Methyloversatilis thermotolerans TaxID=1346290 RepID=UPI00036F8094|nr:hypothetical protein [Methyloversatilis thermotolerans]
MTRMHRLLACSIATLLAAGCSSISFKQGAGGADYRRDERACLGTTTERTAFLQCMEAKGWWTRSTEELATITLVPVDETEQAGEDAMSPAEADAAASHATPAPAGVSAPAAAPPPPASAGASARTAPSTTAAARDPMARVRIAMWSRMGAGTAELIADQKRCLDTLGEAHAPDTTAGTVTRGLYECMRKQGWTGLTLR